MIWACFLLAASVWSASRTFTDADLRRLLPAVPHGSARPTVLYGWSPHMPLSVRGLEELARLGVDRAVTVVPILDASASPSLVAQVMKAHGWPRSYVRRAASSRLIAMGFRVQYPSYLFIHRGRAMTGILPGYKKPASVEEYFKKYLK